MDNKGVSDGDFELVGGLRFEDIRERLLRIGEVDERSHRALAFYLADVAARRLFEDGGHSNAVHFAEAQLEMPARRARELIRVGRELRGLNLVDEAFFAGDISWTKVLLLLRVVQVTTQAVWVDFAAASSCRELDEEVRRCKSGELPGAGSRKSLDANHRTVHAKLDDESYAMFEKMRAFFLDRSGREEMTDGELLKAMTREIADSHPELEADAEPASRLPYEDRNHDEIPTETRQAVMARDRHRCRNCHSYARTHLHHIVFREQGGDNEPTNLVVLCHTCHGLVHRSKLKIQVDPSAANALTFLAANNTPVTRPPRAALKIHPPRENGGRPPHSPATHSPTANRAPRFKVDW